MHLMIFLVGKFSNVNTYKLRASPAVLTMRYCTVELDEEKSKCAGFGQENNSFGSAHLQQHSVQWLVKGAAQLCS